MYFRLVVTVVVFAFFSLPIHANTQHQADELARCLVHEYGCVGKVASELSNTGSPDLAKHVVDAIEAELHDAPVRNRHWILRKLLKLEVEAAYALFWDSVRTLELDFDELEDDLESGITIFSQGFQDYTLQQIERQKDFELASIYFDLLYFFDDSDWSDLDYLADRTWNLYRQAKQSGGLKPGDSALVKHLILENSANQLDKDDADYERLRKIWELGTKISGEPVSAYERLTGRKVVYSYRYEYYKDVDRYYREFNIPGKDGKLPRIVGQPTTFYQLRTQKAFLNRLWSDVEGNTLLIGESGQLHAFDGSKLHRAEDVWKIYSLASKDTSTGLFSRVFGVGSRRSSQYERISYKKFAAAPGKERRMIFVNDSPPTSSDTANYIELTQRSRYILASMDLPDSESTVSVKQFVFEFKTPEAAISALDDISTNTPSELKKTSLWYHGYDGEKQGLILRSYTGPEGDDILISPYRYNGKSLEFPKWGECEKPFSVKSLNENREAFIRKEDHLYRRGYKLQYFNLMPECTISMPWDSEKDVIKRVLLGLEHYGEDEAIKALKTHRVKTRPYRLELLDGADDKSLAYSRIGGDPVIPKKYAADFTWPRFERDGKKFPLKFLLQIDFSELNDSHWNESFPDRGLLSVFYFLDNSGEPVFARGYYFEQPDNLVRLVPEKQDLTHSRGYRWELQRIVFADELLEQYPLREKGYAYDNYNILEKIAEEEIQGYYNKTYGIGAYSKDRRASFVVDRDYPVFMQLPMYGEDVHIILSGEDMDKPTENGFKIIRVYLDWMGHYD